MEFISNPGPRRFLGIALSAFLVASCGHAATDSQRVRALWYGKQSDGSIAQGVTPVVVSADVDESESGVVVDLSEMKRSETGDYWDAAAHSAAVVGTINSAADPRKVKIRFDVDESIDGPSAGGLLAVAVWADLEKERIGSRRSMTGTIMPDGSLGPVGGIPAKIRAASEAGITTVVIPKGQRVSTDPESRQSVDVIEQGRILGVEVIESASVGEAYRVLVNDSEQQIATDPGPLDHDLDAMLATESTETLGLLRKTPVIAGDSAAATARVRHSIKDAVKYSTTALEAGESVAAYAAGSEALGVALSWNAGVAAGRDAAIDLRRAVQDLRAVLRLSISNIETEIDSASMRAVAFVEQVPALVDALCWGVDALNELRQVEHDLESAATPAEVARAASSIAKAQYDGIDRLRTAVSGALLTGNQPLMNESAAWGFIGGYSELLGEAASANIDYATEAGKSRGASVRDQELSQIALAQWEAVSTRGARLGDIAVHTATALAAFVSSSLLVTGIGAIKDLEASDASTSKIAISLRKAFDQQVTVASSIGLDQARLLAGAQLDPSYSVWGNEWGSLLAAQPPDTLIADEIRRDGLTYQIYSNVQAMMLTALDRSIR